MLPLSKVCKGIPFHAVTDNLLGFFYPFDTRTLNLRAGLNLMLGCPRNRREKERLESDGYLPKTGVCPYSEDPEKIRKKRQKGWERNKTKDRASLERSERRGFCFVRLLLVFLLEAYSFAGFRILFFLH